VRTVYVAEYPAIQHLHPNNEVVTVRLKRVAGDLRATCTECDTEFVYRKPQKSLVRHYKSPILPSVKGNFDSDDDH
jgi:hypothetical protein